MMPSKKSSKKGHSPGQKETGRPQDATSDKMRYPIPKASVDAWQAIKTQRDIPLNPGLIFDRFAPDWSDTSTLKKDGLEAVRQAAKRADQALLRAWNARWEAAARAACAETFSLKTDWRLIAGLGRKGALEVGFTFHRYGFPILPGSSVKGLARAWALIEIAQKVNVPSLKDLDEILATDGAEDSEERKRYEEWRGQQSEAVQRQAEDFRIIFGTTAVAGRAVFFDAIPQDKPTLDLDVMNPHFPKYYSGEEPPTDWQSPIPVYFLAVAPQTEFRFAVGWRSALDAEGVRLRKLAIDWLTQGLTELGAGGKTSAGYGYFVHDLEGKGAPAPETGEQTVSREAPGQPTDPHQRLVDDFKRNLQALPTKDVAGQIALFVTQWRQAELTDEYRLQMAQAILEKVEAAGRTKKSQDKEWFQELRAFVAEHGADKRGG